MRVLRPFDSSINTAPYTRATVRSELAHRFARVPGGGVVARLVLSEPLYPLVLRLLSWGYRRPGRAYTFLARRP